MKSKNFELRVLQSIASDQAIEPGSNLSRDIHLADFRARLASLMSKRAVRHVVTRTGRLCRGQTSSIKAPRGARYESLLERDTWRIFEVAPSIRVLRTHPFVLALPGQPVRHYTPDACIEGPGRLALVEVKARYFLRTPEQRQRLSTVIKRLERHGLSLIVMDESDIRPPGLQQELETLLRLRPLVGRYRQSIDASAWDPVGGSQPSAEIERRWRDAKRICDDLLQRVMRRDPDEFVHQGNH